MPFIAATVIISKRMLPSLAGIVKSTSKTLFDIIKEANHYDDPSLLSFNPSSNAPLHGWGCCGIARDLDKSHSLVVYIELFWELCHCVINKVG